MMLNGASSRHPNDGNRRWIPSLGAAGFETKITRTPGLSTAIKQIPSSTVTLFQQIRTLSLGTVQHKPGSLSLLDWT